MDFKGTLRAASGPHGKIPLLFSWLLVAFILVVGPLNPNMSLEFDPHIGAPVLLPVDYEPTLPSAIIAERSLLYGGLLIGAMVQSLALFKILDSRTRIRRIIGVLAINALLASIIGASLKLGGSEKILGFAQPVHPEFFGPFRYHNHWTAFAILGFFQAFSLALYYFRQDKRTSPEKFHGYHFAFLGFAVTIGMTLPLSGARAGILFALLTGFTAWFLCLRFGLGEPKSSRHRPQSPLRSFLLPGLIALISVGCILLLANKELSSAVRETRQSLEVARDKGFESLETPRLSGAWKEMGELISQRPVFGWGFGGHLYAFYLVASPEYRNPDGSVFARKEFAHNDWLQFIAEIGLVGFLALIVPPLILWWRNRQTKITSPFAATLGSGCLLVLLLATFEFPLSNPAILLLFFVQATLSLRYHHLEASAQGKVNRLD
ncbi:MAG: O-antigen ligase family protein [Puniceicoccaceae bacterium]